MSGKIPELSVIFPEKIQAISRKFPGNVREMSGNFMENPENRMFIRSHGNSRGVNSREVRGVLGHNS